MMTLVEKKYNEALDKMSGMERLARTCSLFDSIYEMISLQVSREFPGIEGRALRCKVAERLYMSDEKTLKLIKQVSER